MKNLLIIFVLFFLNCAETPEDNEEVHNEKISSGATGLLVWKAPAGWVKETPTSSMRKDQYSIPATDGDTEDASVVVYYFQGGGGSVEANIERWQEQFKRMDENTTGGNTKVETKEIHGLMQTRVDIFGTYLFRVTPGAAEHTEKPDFRLLAAVVESSAGPYFIKFVGPEATVSKWQGSFYQFMNSFKE